MHAMLKLYPPGEKHKQDSAAGKADHLCEAAVYDIVAVVRWIMHTIYINQYDEHVMEICRNDSEMRKLVSAVGNIEISLRTDFFASLIRSIVGQQISVAAANAIYDRLLVLLNHDITADTLLQKSDDALRGAGLTHRKIGYVRDLADKAASGKIDLEKILLYDDKAVIRQLTSIKGIGKWTAEMFLILSLGRKDILAIVDVGLQRAAMWLYKTEKAERRNILIEKAEQWKPYRSAASFYLWEAVHFGFVTDYNTIDDVPVRKAQAPVQQRTNWSTPQ